MLYPYIASYLKSHDPSVTFSEVFNAQAFSLLLENLGVVSAPHLAIHLGVRTTLLIGGLLCAVGYGFCSFVTNTGLLVAIYSIFFGVGSGMITITTFWPAWDHFPNNRGKVTGFIMSGYSLATIVFGLMFTFIVNPKNVVPQRSGNDVNFGEEVNSTVPYGMLAIGFTFAVVTLVAIFMIRPTNIHSQTSMSSPPGKFPLAKVLGSMRFWNLFGVGYTVFFFWYFFAGVYKSYGLKTIGDDHFLSYIGSVSGICAGIGRIFWPWFLDIFKFRAVLTVTMTIQGMLCLSLHFISGSKLLYGLAVPAIFFCTSAQYPSLAVETAKIYTVFSSQVWPLVFFGVTLASATAILLKYVAEIIGYLYIFVLAAFVIGISILLLWILNDEPVVWEEKPSIEDELEEPLLKI